VLNAAQAVGAEGSIQIQLDPAPGGTLLRFQDDGPGLAEEVIPLLFEPFATTRIEGTGLGLSTTQRIVEGHGGTITPHNGAKGGACFDLYFPSPPA
jgi:signal transduction histidine kinase